MEIDRDLVVPEAGQGGGALPGLAAGSQVRVPLGWRHVEFLRRGDLVVTRGGGLQPLRLIWRRTVSAAQMTACPALAPVRLRPRVIGPMMPRRDLLLGGAQRLLVPGHLVSAPRHDGSALICAAEVAGRSDGAFVDLSLREVTYYTLVLDAPHILQVEGLPVESFTPTLAALRDLGEGCRTDIVRLYPELGRSPSAYPPSVYPVISGDAFRAAYV